MPQHRAADAGSAEDQGYRFRIYIDRPGKFVDPADRPDPHSKDGLSETGHLFMSLVDSKGFEDKIGFYAKAHRLGNEHVPPADRLQGFKTPFKKVAGFIQDESDRRFQEMVEYKISQDQYKKISDFVRTWEKQPPKYSLALNNCTTFALKAAEAGGLKPPPRLALGLDVPTGVMAGQRLRETWQKVTGQVDEAAGKLHTRFSGSRKAPRPRGRIMAQHDADRFARRLGPAAARGRA